MTKIIHLTFLLFTIQSSSQTKPSPSLETQLYRAMDQVAAQLIQDANIHCVSISVVKEGVN
ncbi:MAG TPA: hypothetical protein VLB84_10950, partial [Bacteroidia bacterium]|nr:hypothetical protein [Bacteroidia bacterium]